jgi:hypothetical protein
MEWRILLNMFTSSSLMLPQMQPPMAAHPDKRREPVNITHRIRFAITKPSPHGLPHLIYTEC